MKKKAYDPTLSVRTPIEVRKALQAFAATGRYTLSQATCVILQEWLRTHGWLVEADHKPIGPATDVVKAMDGAIAEDRRRRPKR